LTNIVLLRAHAFLSYLLLYYDVLKIFILLLLLYTAQKRMCSVLVISLTVPQ